MCLALLTGWALYVRWTHTPASGIDVRDAFETRGLSRIWDTGRFVPGAVTMQSEVVRAGRGAAKVVLHSRDKFEAGVKGSKDTERDELLEASRLYSTEGKTYEYSFSMFLPADFPIVPTRLVIAQWKQDCDGHEACSDDSPVVAMRYVAGTLRITHQTGGRQTALYATSGEVRGRWNDFRFRIRFTPRESGALEAWMNSAQVVNYRGVNAYQESPATGYVSPSRFYFKMGLYRDLMAQPMTIYIDEYRKRELTPAETETPAVPRR